MWPQAASRLWSADKPRPQPPTASTWTNSSWHPKTAKAVFQESRPTTWCMTPAAVAYPPPYASGGPAGGQTVAFDPREQGDGLRPKPLLHSGSVGSFQGHQGFASPRSSPVRCSPVPGCAPRAASGRALDTLSTPTAKHAIRKRPSSLQGPFPGFGIPKAPRSRENAL